MKFFKFYITALMTLAFLLCSSGCRDNRSLTVDLFAEAQKEVQSAQANLLFQSEPTAQTGESETMQPETTAETPEPETMTASSTVFVSTPESTAYITMPAPTTVYVSTPESTVLVTAQTESQPVYTLPPATTATQTQATIPVTTAPPTQAITAPTQNSDTAQDYVLNKSSKKFHTPSCGSVSQMKPSNKEDVHTTRDELIAQGYTPCGRCKP